MNELEYIYVQTDSELDDDGFEKYLNEKGKDGWELAYMNFMFSRYVCVFMRVKVNTKKRKH